MSGVAAKAIQVTLVVAAVVEAQGVAGVDMATPTAAEQTAEAAMGEEMVATATAARSKPDNSLSPSTIEARCSIASG